METLTQLDYDSPRYAEICEQLGADTRVRFVRVLTDQDGREEIDYTVGKPEEVLWLYGQARDAGFAVSTRMIENLQARYPHVR